MADVFPNETYPTDSAVAMLDGTADQPTGLPYVAKGTGPASVPSYEIQYNRRQQRENRRLAVATEGLVVDEGGLMIGVYPCNYTLGGQQKRFAGATNQAVPDDATRFVYIDASNTMQIAASYPMNISTFIPLAKVVTSSGAKTIETDVGYARLAAGPLGPGIVATVGVEASDTIAVTLQLEDAGGNPVTQRWLGEIWLSDSDFGDLATLAPTGGVSVTTGQQLGSHLVSNKHLKAVSDANGKITLDVTDSGTPTFYVMASAVGAKAPVSAAITFA